MFCVSLLFCFSLTGDSSPGRGDESRLVQLQSCVIGKGLFVASDWADAAQRKE